MKDELFDLFYSKLLPMIVDCLATTKDHMTKSSVLEILICCANTHGQRIRYFIIHNEVMQHLQGLYSDRSKSIKLGMIKLSKALIASKDDALIRYILKHDLFAPIFTIWQRNKRENLLTSSLLELFDIVSSTNSRSLIAYMMEKYKSYIVEEPYSKYNAMKLIKSKYELALQERTAKKAEAILSG